MSEHRLDEILIERPRSGWRKKTSRNTKFWRQLTEEASTDGLLRPYRIKTRDRTKYLSDNLGPLRGFLQSRVGQQWDEVYSELSQRLDRNTVSGQHVIQHLWLEVYRYVEIIDGVVYSKAGADGWYGSRELGRWRRDFYVHPQTGVLCVVNRKPRRAKPKPDKDVIKINDRYHYRKINGIWYEIELQDIPRFRSVRDVVLKVTVSPTMSDRTRHLICHTYWQFGKDQYAARKRQCNKKELKHISKQINTQQS
ncbi:MAG: hypothetical protein AAGD25_01940 [Cyanobacteria bacterium P01_F01_bin.150]